MVTQGLEPIKRLLRVDLGTLELAFDNSSDETTYYLDLENGEVITVTAESQFELEALRGEWESSERLVDLATFVQQSDTPEWMLEMMYDALRVEGDKSSRFIEVPLADSREGCRDMADFAATVQDELLQRRLWQAVEGKSPLRRFKELLLNFPEERERWCDFKGERVAGRMLNWLDSNGIRPIMSDDES